MLVEARVTFPCEILTSPVPSIAPAIVTLDLSVNLTYSFVGSFVRVPIFKTAPSSIVVTLSLTISAPSLRFKVPF